MRIATWNINSVRLRQNMVIKALQAENIDVLCLQETKTQDEFFPKEAFIEAGYPHIAIRGEKSYNGVAIISKLPVENVQRWNIVNEDARHIAATLPNGVDLHSIYIPAGGDEPDRDINPKFGHKLDYVDELGKIMQRHYSATDKVLAVGDFNIAPYEHDVWSHKQLLKVVSHTPIEVEKLLACKASLDFNDIARRFVPESEKLYSWWSYRNRDWRKSNRGRRLDHIWATQTLAKQITDFTIIDAYRDHEKPSDHVPVIVDVA